MQVQRRTESSPTKDRRSTTVQSHHCIRKWRLQAEKIEIHVIVYNVK